MEKNKENIMHWIRVNRTEERLINQVYQVTPFGSPIKLSDCDYNHAQRMDDIRVRCGEISFIVDRKELTQWK